MSHGASPHSFNAARRGLATLEMVLALPILLFVMALMINFGTYACWKVRGLSIARQAVWGTRWPRTGASDPRPAYWPATASVSTSGPVDVAQVDDARVDQPVARGPLSGAQVNAELLDPGRGLRQGSAGITRPFPLMVKEAPFHLDIATSMLDDRWQYPQMGMSDNQQRRIPVLYTLAKAPASLGNAYIQAIMAILNAPFRPQLQPLDNDPDFIAYSILFHWGSGAPDFYPRLSQFCSVDSQVAQAQVQSLIDRIQGKAKPHVPSVAETMTRAFINLYQRVIQAYQNQMNTVPPPSQSQIAAIQASIAALQAEIKTLTTFLKTLQKQNGG